MVERLVVSLPSDADIEGLDVLAERTTSGAVFLPERWGGGSLAVGTRVDVRIVAAHGAGELARFTGVIAWRHRDGSAPAGREPGSGIAVNVDDLEALVHVMSRRGSGARIRVPGQRVLARQRLPGSALPAPRALPSPPPPALAASKAVGAASPPLEAPPPPFDDVFAAADEASPATRSVVFDRLGVLRNALASQPGDGEDTVDATAVAPFPADEGATAPPRMAAVRSSPFTEVLTRADDLTALPDAGEDPTGFSTGERAFEPQPTDVDLLKSLSADDLLTAEPQTVAAAGPASTTGDDLSLVEADLIDSRPDAGVDDDDVRDVPAPDAWPTTETPLPPGPVGVAFTAGQRGVSAVEPFAWASMGTKRPHRPDFVDDGGDVDVFSPPAARPAPVEDPFAPRITDPRLSVDHLVARAVRAAQMNVDLDLDSVFGASSVSDEPTRDGSPLPSEESSTGSGDSASTSSDDTGDGAPPV